MGVAGECCVGWRLLVVAVVDAVVDEMRRPEGDDGVL